MQLVRLECNLSEGESRDMESQSNSQKSQKYGAYAYDLNFRLRNKRFCHFNVLSTSNVFTTWAATPEDAAVHLLEMHNLLVLLVRRRH